jgi:acetylornithine deacetylase/succinyl-diaminopimelate desuccinylase-like protein
MINPDKAVAAARASRRRFLLDLAAFLRFPSVSGRPELRADVQRCADWLAEHLRRIGLDEVLIVPTAGHPIVYAQWLRAAKRPTLLIYGHYDVQPADDNSQWPSPPFVPTLRDGAIFARGASDDKGQLFIHVKALQSYLEAVQAIPVNIKCIFEGEEEIGSTHLAAFIDGNRDALASDVAVMSDTQMLAHRPAMVYSLRGLLNVELEVSGPGREIHSGLFGGAIRNPAQALSEIIAKLHTPEGRIAIPGFYDSVRRLSLDERRLMKHSGPTDAEILRDAGTLNRWGEPGFSLYERVTIRPSLSVTGISGGYTGPGVKAVIPGAARAKLSFRLVPDQRPEHVERQLRSYLERIAPGTDGWKIRVHSKAKPVVIDRSHRAIKAAELAYQKAFGAPPALVRSGGSIPVVALLKEKLGIPTVLMGFGAPDDRRHGPGEKLNLRNYYKGIEASIWFMALLSGLPMLRPARIRGSGRSVHADAHSGIVA